MSNTVQTAKNTFAKGIIMDFAPEITKDDCLTNALNATLVTFNGNELSLQNDMGNGRVETARLPEGYVPVGTCEFGDIIYIVSYNPILNKSQIGCFPSPERNISSTEVGESGVTIDYTDFLEVVGGKLTGKLKTDNKKYIVYNKSLNPGDKYIISSGDLKDNLECLSDIGDTSHTFGSTPRYLTLHVVSIEDDGKITYLDSSVKWYSKGEDGEQDYYLLLSATDTLTNDDIDSYRDKLSSGYSVFQSKVSGKLAILAELERISGFNCTYKIFRVGDYKYKHTVNITSAETALDEDVPSTISTTSTTLATSYGDEYKIYLETDWETDNDSINPQYLVLTESECNPLTLSVNISDIESFLFIKDGSAGSINYIPLNYPIAYDKNGYWNTPYTNSTENEFTDKVKATLSYDDGLPNIGKYYLDLARISKDDDGKVIYLNSNNENIEPTEIGDNIINSYFKTGVIKYFAKVDVPKYCITESVDSKEKQKQYYYDNVIYHYEVTPAMAYGLLDDLAVSGYIDFSKIDSGEINVSQWKYYNTSNLMTLTLGLDVYPEPNKGVKEVVIEFYDNLGIAAAYHIIGRDSYSGVFTEYIPLNGSATTYKLNNIDAYGNTIEHAGIPSETGTVTLNGETYEDDGGILYSNIVYLAKIVVKYCDINVLGEYTESSDYSNTTYERWLWTNTMFNDYYYDTLDFKNIQFNLTMDLNIGYTPASSYTENTVYYKPDSYGTGETDNLCADINYLHGDINVDLYPTFQNNYSSFAIDNAKLPGEYCYLYKGKSVITNPTSYTMIKTGNSTYNYDYTLLQSDGDSFYISSTLGDLLGLSITSENSKELWDTDLTGNYNNHMNILINSYKTYTHPFDYYYDYNSEEVSVSDTATYLGLGVECDSEKASFVINTEIENFNKYYVQVTNQNVTANITQSLISTKDDLSDYGLYYADGHIYVSDLLELRVISESGDTSSVDVLGNIINTSSGEFSLTTTNDKYTKLYASSSDTTVSQNNLSSLNSLNKIFLIVYNENLSNNDITNDKYLFLSNNKEYSDDAKLVSVINNGMSFLNSSDDLEKSSLNITTTTTGINPLVFIGIKNPSGGIHIFNTVFVGQREIEKTSQTLLQTFKMPEENKYQVNKCKIHYYVDGSDNFIINKVDNIDVNTYTTVRTATKFSPTWQQIYYNESTGEYTLDNTKSIPTDSKGMQYQLHLGKELVDLNNKSIVSAHSGGTVNITTNAYNLGTTNYYIGDFIASVLASLYVRNTSSGSIDVPCATDCIYLSPQTTSYMLELIGQTNFEELGNSFITLGNMNYEEYITMVKTYSKSESESGNANVDVKIIDTVKTFPLQFNVSGVIPSSATIINSTSNPELIKYFGDEVAQIYSGDTIYGYGETLGGDVIDLSESHSIKYYSGFTITTSNIIQPGTLYETSNNKYIIKWLSNNTDSLKLNNQGSSYLYSLAIKDNNSKIALTDLSLVDILIPKLQIFNV